MSRQVVASLLWLASAGLFFACLLAERYQTGAVLLAPTLVTAAVVLCAACLGRPWALKLCLFALIVSIDLTFRRRDASDLSADPQIVLKLAVWLALFCVGASNLPATARYFRNPASLGFLAYFLLAAASTLYSLAPRYTLGCAVGYLAVLPFLALVVDRLELGDILTTGLAATGFHVVLALGLIPFDPGLVYWNNWASDQPRLEGLLGHPFRMADMAALFILCGWLLWREQRLPAVAVAAVFALGVAALVLTDVRSSVASLGLAFFAVGRIRTPSLTAFGGLLIAGLIVIVAVPDVLERIAPHFSRGGNAEQALTLTGRTDIWAQSLSLFEQRPVLGYGYASTRILFPEEFVTLNAKALPPPHAHNVIIQSLVAMGIIGTLLLLVPLLSQVVYAVRHRDAPINAFICYSLIMSLTSLGSIGTAPNALSVFWIVTILLTSNAAAPCVARAMAGGAARRIQEAGSPSRRQQSLARRRGWQDDRSAPQSPP